MPGTEAPYALMPREDPRGTRIRHQSRDGVEEADQTRPVQAHLGPIQTRLHFRRCHHLPSSLHAEAWPPSSAALPAESSRADAAAIDCMPSRGRPPPLPCHQALPADAMAAVAGGGRGEGAREVELVTPRGGAAPPLGWGERRRVRGIHK
jgi:hypothetical protein